MKKTILIGVLFFVTPFVSSAAVSLTQTVNLTPGWNVVSTPRILESHTFSAPETIQNFSIFTLDPSRPTGWATLADLGQAEFAPLYGYFINNNTGISQTLTFNYKASTTPNERLFERNFTVSGWYSIGVSNPTYADRQAEPVIDENNPSQVMNSVLLSSDMVVDFTDANAVNNPSSVELADPWKSAIASDADTLADIRDTKAYAIYIRDTQSNYVGFQNESDDGGMTTPSYTLGSLDISKKSDSPSGIIALNSTSTVLARYVLTASGESIKVENLKISADASTVGTDVQLRNGALFADGVQVGSTASILDIDNGVGYTQFNLGSSLVVASGTPVVLEVRADVYNEGATPFADGDTVIMHLVAGTNNLKRMQTLDYFSNNSADANLLTVGIGGGLSGTKNSSYANQSVAMPQTAYKIGAFNVTSAGPESVNIDTITLNFSSASTSLENITDVYVKYGTNTTSVKNSVVAGDNTFSISEVLASGNTLPVEVYATLSSSIGNSDTVIVRLSVSGTTSNTAQAVTTNFVTGQTIIAVVGSISATFVNNSTSATRLQVGNTSPKVASFRFTALNDTFTVTDIAVKVGGIAAAGAIRDITLKSAGMTDKIISLNGLVATSTGMSVTVLANGGDGKIVDVYLNLNDVGNNAATSSANVTVTLEGFISNSSTGTRSESSTDVTSNNQYVFKSIPTITNVSLPSTLLSAGTKTLSKVQISADAAGQISWKKLVWTIAKTSGVTIGSLSAMQMVDSSGNIITGTFATTTGAIVAGDIYAPNSTGGTLSFVADSEQQITTGETYSLKGTIGGTMTAGNSIATSIANPSTTIAIPNAYSVIAGADGTQTPSFVWSDRSALSHGLTTADWVNDYKVKGLPTDFQALSI